MCHGALVRCCLAEHEDAGRERGGTRREGEDCGEGTESVDVGDGRKGKKIWGEGRMSRISVFTK